MLAELEEQRLADEHERRRCESRKRGVAAMAVGQIELALGAGAPDFRLPATDGRTYALKDVSGAKGAVVVFICNHCPYVKAVIDRLTADARLLMGEGVGFAAISSNDATSYPEDSFPKMRAFAAKHDFPFPYLYDESQDVARAYGAVCTPDFFGFDRDLKLKYRGRLDEGRTTPPPPNARRELLEAIRAIASGAPAPANQVPSIGCSIKWKAE
jgi:peroxiredoxin